MSDAICLIGALGADADTDEYELRLPPGFAAHTAAVAGNFTAWVPLVMEADPVRLLPPHRS